MGFIPIILVFFLTLIIWAILNYNSFVAKKTSAELIGFQREKLINQRSVDLLELNTLLRINALTMPDVLIQLANEPEKTTPISLDEHLSVIRQLAETTAGLAENPDFRQKMKSLMASEPQIKDMDRKYRSAIADYNKQVREKPSKFVAQVFGFKNI
ncbi:MAG: LemA family protein [Verrucomicrobia bacterium]|nr:LemA family protein [Cytophagales bacterium]